MARVIPFPTPESTPNTTNVVLTRDDHKERLISETSYYCKRLLGFYRSTGLWHDKCNRPMSMAIHSLQDVCNLMLEQAHVKE